MPALDRQPPKLCFLLRVQDAEPKPLPGSEIQVFLDRDQGKQRPPALVSLSARFSGSGIKVFRAELEILPAAHEKRQALLRIFSGHGVESVGLETLINEIIGRRPGWPPPVLLFFEQRVIARD